MWYHKIKNTKTTEYGASQYGGRGPARTMPELCEGVQGKGAGRR